MVTVTARLLRSPWSVDTTQHVVHGDIDLRGNREWVFDTTIPRSL